MKKGFFAFAVLLLASAFARGADLGNYGLMSGAFDFAAPVVKDTTVLSNVQAGQIIFDATNAQFRGYDTTGTWLSLSSPSGTGNVTSPNTSGVKVLSGLITYSGGYSVTRSDGSKITYTSSGGTGLVTLALGSVFTSTPNCVATIYATGSTFSAAIDTISSNSVTVRIGNDVGSAADKSFFIMCVGN